MPHKMRSPSQVAYRALAVFAVVGVAMGADRVDTAKWLTDNDIRTKLAPFEANFIDTPVLSERQRIDAGWMSERLVVIAWALGLIEHLPRADEQCDTGALQDVLPPFASVTVSDFVAAACLRPPTELMAMADEIQALHWEARDAGSTGRPLKAPVDLEIIQERHHAINWIIGYDGLDWDDITTDT